MVTASRSGPTASKHTRRNSAPTPSLAMPTPAKPTSADLEMILAALEGGLALNAVRRSGRTPAQSRRAVSTESARRCVIETGSDQSCDVAPGLPSVSGTAFEAAQDLDWAPFGGRISICGWQTVSKTPRSGSAITAIPTVCECRRGDLNSPPPSGNERQQAAGSGKQRQLATGRNATCRSLPLLAAGCH